MLQRPNKMEIVCTPAFAAATFTTPSEPVFGTPMESHVIFA
jgi:hypothetical protein